LLEIIHRLLTFFVKPSCLDEERREKWAAAAQDGKRVRLGG
jgi:hypothetical protein